MEQMHTVYSIGLCLGLNNIRRNLYNDEDIVGLEIMNGTPLIYELDENLKTIRKYYLQNPTSVVS